MRRLRVLLVTPFSPVRSHDHAAGDISLPFCSALADRVDLHVFAADHVESVVECEQGSNSFKVHGSISVARPQLWRRLAPYPYRLRLAWDRDHTRRVRELVDELAPDILHVEYIQPAELLLGPKMRVPLTVTFHDVTHRVVAAEVGREARVTRRAYLRWEYVLMRRLERRATTRAAQTFCFSERDALVLRGLGGFATRVSLGINESAYTWRSSGQRTILFAGALWRHPNQMSAEFLAREVLPLVRQRHPDVQLKIVGARPAAAVVALGELPGVTVVANVPDLDREFSLAAMTLAPSMVEAGVLLKSLRPMAMGAPVVLNDHSAAPIRGLVPGQHALVANSAEATAEAIIALLENEALARSLGQNGSTLVRSNFSWSACADQYVRAWNEVMDQHRS